MVSLPIWNPKLEFFVARLILKDDNFGLFGIYI